MRRARWLVGLAAVCALAAAGCSWSRFDDLQENAPVVLLKEPGGMGAGFGSSVASISTADDAHALVAAASAQTGAAEYRIGFGQNPVLDTIDAVHCRQDCSLAASVAGLARAQTPTGPRAWCWATGSSALGVLVHCGDGEPFPDHALDTPGVTLGATDRLVLASDRADEPALAVATTAGSGRAWFHPPLDMAPVELVAPSAEPGFGASVAVAELASGRVYAVGAPESAKVLLFAASADGKSIASTGCVSGSAGFGRVLAAGDVDGVDGDELAVTADDHVAVLDGLAGLAQGGNCVAADSARLVRIECASTSDVSGCGAGSGFGDALAIGDLNGDGNGELIVGAPGMSARGQDGAGAIAIFDIDLSGARPPESLTEAKLISSAETGDALGSSLATVRQRANPLENPRHVLLSGAPGGDKAAIFYCFGLPSGKRGSRCQ